MDLSLEGKIAIATGGSKGIEDIAALALFLVSDRAGAITGQTIAVEGGAGRGIHY